MTYNGNDSSFQRRTGADKKFELASLNCHFDIVGRNSD